MLTLFYLANGIHHFKVATQVVIVVFVLDISNFSVDASKNKQSV